MQIDIVLFRKMVQRKSKHILHAIHFFPEYRALCKSQEAKVDGIKDMAPR